MDPLAVFKREIFRPIVITVVPGLTAIAPFLVAIHQYIPAAFGFHIGVVVGLVLIAAIAAGFVIENLGSQVEDLIWQFVKGKKGDDEWYQYLIKRFDGQVVALGYIADIVLRLKFETSFAVALIINSIGLVWLQILGQISSIALLILVGIAFVLAIYLILESRASIKLLKKIRRKLLSQEHDVCTPKENSR